MGHPGAAHYLARLYRRGARKVLQLRPHAGRAAHFLALAVEGGHPEALFEAADGHAHGTDGAPVDLPRALELYTQAGRAGHVGALVSAGAMHYHGRGTPRDFARALALYTEAGQAGSVKGWENVAAMWAMGQGVPANLETAKYIRGRIIPPLLEAQAAAAAAGGGEAEDEKEEEAEEASQQGGGCGKPTCRGGGCATRASVPPAGAPSSTCAEATHACATSEHMRSGASGPSASLSSGTGGPSSIETADGIESSDGAVFIATSVYRASDPAIQAPRTRQGSGDSPDDPIVLDMSAGTAARIVDSLHAASAASAAAAAARGSGR
jgi:hypothetical protein